MPAGDSSALSAANSESGTTATFMAAVAARTSTLRVGTGIFLLPVHNPVRVAEQVATIDQISGGRISLGVGSGVISISGSPA